MKKAGTRITLAELEALLDNLEKRAAATDDAAAQARMLNLAGDVCSDADQLDRGLAYYDQAITRYTAIAQYQGAARICEKIIALKPNAVRPFFTLTQLAIRQNQVDQARERIAQYVTAADAQKLGQVARRYLLELAGETADPVLLEAIGAGVKRLNE